MNTERIEAFHQLGAFIRRYLICLEDDAKILPSEFRLLDDISSSHESSNPWFIKSNILSALKGISIWLDRDKLNTWLKDFTPPKNPKTIACIMAGNIPLVGFHDFLSIVISGNTFLGKLSHKDNKLLPYLADKLIEINENMKDQILFTGNKIKGMDACIATGSDNSSRYFEYSFGSYPSIIRKNRNSIAILDTHISDQDLMELNKDVFLYFGLGCRNVSKLYIPIDFNLKSLTASFKKQEKILDHKGYRNNYLYQKAIRKLGKAEYIDAGPLILQENLSHSSPVSVVHYEYYTDKSQLWKRIDSGKDKIQCIAGNIKDPGHIIPYGKTQFPELDDYADDKNSLEFLRSLENY